MSDYHFLTALFNISAPPYGMPPPMPSFAPGFPPHMGAPPMMPQGVPMMPPRPGPPGPPPMPYGNSGPPPPPGNLFLFLYVLIWQVRDRLMITMIRASAIDSIEFCQ